jgi:hypothetical protein
VAKNHCLTALELAGTGFGDKDAVAFERAMRSNTTLVRLEIFANEASGLGSQAMGRLFDVVSANTELMVIEDDPAGYNYHAQHRGMRRLILHKVTPHRRRGQENTPPPSDSKLWSTRSSLGQPCAPATVTRPLLLHRYTTFRRGPTTSFWAKTRPSEATRTGTCPPVAFSSAMKPSLLTRLSIAPHPIPCQDEDKASGAGAARQT